jgi:hypothetical protein
VLAAAGISSRGEDAGAAQPAAVRVRARRNADVGFMIASGSRDRSKAPPPADQDLESRGEVLTPPATLSS